MVSYFPALELKYDPETKLITIPTFRQDLVGMCDIAEEVADKILEVVENL